AIESIAAARKELGRFQSIFEFCEKVDLRLLNRRVIESLIKSGAMDSLAPQEVSAFGAVKDASARNGANGNGADPTKSSAARGRAQLMAALDKAMERAQTSQRAAESGQHGLFGVFAEDQPAANDRLPEAAEWDEPTRLAYEKEILGFFITGHPLEKYRDKLLDFGAKTTEEITAMKQSTAKDETVCAGGIITGLRVLKSKKGEMYAQGRLEDMAGGIDLLVFPEAYRRLAGRLVADVPVLLRGGVRMGEGSNAKFTVAEAQSLEEAKPKLPRSLPIRLPLG